MAPNIQQEVAVLKRMTPKQLRERYAEVFGETTHSGNKNHLVRKLAWGIQAKAEGGISERARRRAEELAKGTDIRTTMPKASAVTSPEGSVQSSANTATHRVRFTSDERLPMPGAVLTRKYKGRTIEVTVLAGGFFEYEGERFKSLSGVAKAITGSHCNGFAFFGLTKPNKQGSKA